MGGDVHSLSSSVVAEMVATSPSIVSSGSSDAEKA